MLSEIGSNFWLDPNLNLEAKPLGSPMQFNCKGSDYAWLSTGRSSIQFVLNSIEERSPCVKKVAVLPSFTCNTVIEPFLKSGYKVFYYPIKRNLTTTSEAIFGSVIKHEASIVLFHRYFGFETLDGQMDRMCNVLRELGKFSIEDCTQCLYSDISRTDADYVVGSIRKWIGTPDGGFAVCREGRFLNKPHYSDKELVDAKMGAFHAKYRYLFEHKGDKEDMLAMYRHAESILDNQRNIYCISEVSARVQANLNRSELIRKRRENYGILSKALNQSVSLVFALHNNEVPLYFPIFVNDRGALQKQLAYNAIYAPVVWPKDGKQPRQCVNAESAYEHLLCIPIDQRYGPDDMERIIEVINVFYK